MSRAKKYSELTEKVIKQLGGSRDEALGDLRDLARHGDASSGWSGFIYYSDTRKFAFANYDLILEAMEETLGGEMPGAGAKFASDPLNWMAWFALETAAWEVSNV